MRLLFLSTEFPSPCDPAKATFNRELLRSLAERHEVQVISAVPWLDRLRFRPQRLPSPLAWTRYEAGMTISHPTYYYTPKVLRRHYHRFLKWSLNGPLKRLASQPRPDCILSYWAHPDGSVAVEFARQWRVPCITMVGGSDVLLMTRAANRRERIRQALQRADAVVTVSGDLQDKVRELGVAPSAVHLLRRGVDGRRFFDGDRNRARAELGLPLDQRMLLWVGRMVPVKGLNCLLAAFQLLIKTDREARLYLVGDGPLRSELEEAARLQGIAARVHFVGAKSHAELGSWFRATDVTVLPSLSEGIPNVLLESLACNRPFVASNVGGVPEIAGHDAACLVPPNQPRELAGALERMLTCPPRVAAEHRPATLEDFAAAVERLIRGVVAEYASRDRQWVPEQAGGESTGGTDCFPRRAVR